MERKKAVSCLLIGCCVFSHMLTAQTIERDAKLETATIYGGGAALHHLAQGVSIPAGNSELVINRIAQQVDEQSIRVMSSRSSITVLSAAFERDYLNKGDNKSTVYLENRQRMNDAITLLNDLSNQRKSEESTLSLLEANKNIGGQSGVTPAQLKTMIQYYRDQYKSISDGIVVLKAKEETQQAIVDRLKKQMQDVDSTSQNAGQLVLRIHSAEAVTADFTIDYFTPNVSWSPFYEIKVDDLDAKLKLIYKADIVQNTGIDWKQVHLKFATGSPEMNNTAPELRPWWLRYRQPVPVKAMEKRVSRPLADEMAIVNYGTIDMANAVDNQLNTEFVIHTPYDIYSNGKPQSVQLKSHEIAATYAFLTIPKQDQTAFLIGKITGWDQLNLLPGNANLIIDNAYAGKSYIDPNEVTDTLNLSLGRDKRIVVQRTRIDEQGKNAFIGNARKQEFTYEISIRNTRQETIEIEVKDQFPLSTEKDIQVDLGEVSGAKIDAEKGELSWKLKLAPAETKKVTFHYQVKYSKDKTLTGL